VQEKTLGKKKAIEEAKSASAAQIKFFPA